MMRALWTEFCIYAGEHTRRDDSAAGPIINFVVVCASTFDVGFSSNFVTKPFAFIHATSYKLLFLSYIFGFIVFLFCTI